MNFTIIRALLEDSRQQVLDNKVFRLLVILTGIPILMTFVVGVYPDRMEVLWFDPISWKGLISSLGGPSGSLGGEQDFSIEFIQGFQNLIVTFFAGSLGVMFSIAATAFFMPRVLEKGAADTLFSKPVSRLAILLSRYLAGLFFIAGIAFVLVFGMYLGLGIRSGYWDAGFLWGSITLVYLFGMMHSISICVAVLTRSSTAAILITIVLFMICGSVHRAWAGIEYVNEMKFIQGLRTAQQEGEEDAEAEAASEDNANIALTMLVNSLYGLHYVLPKTTDADVITKKLQRALTERAPDFTSDDGELVIKRAPRDFVYEPQSAAEFEGSGLRWVADTDAGAADGLITLRRFPRPQVERGRGERKRMLPQTGSARSKEFKKELAGREDLVGEPESNVDGFGGVRMFSVTWKETSGDAIHLHERLTFHFGQSMYELDFGLREGFDPGSDEAADPDSSDDDAARRRADSRRERFLSPRNMVLGSELAATPEKWYERAFSLTAPWRYNILFSIGSSLAFIFSMLLIAWLRLRRIDF